GTPATTGRLLNGPTGRCGASARASGPNGWRPRPATWPPPCAGTSPTTGSRCRTCSGCCAPSGCCATTRARLARGSASCCRPPTPSTQRPAPRGAEARAGLVGAAGVIATELGADPAALAARLRLAPLLDEINDPYLGAVSRLALAWSSPITDDFDGALRDASVSLEQLRGQ